MEALEDLRESTLVKILDMWSEENPKEAVKHLSHPGRKCLIFKRSDPIYRGFSKVKLLGHEMHTEGKK